ncbi:hypothetical protein Adt_21473 [Abeliophyllum distichum]|uniref:Uncharacterized protein n=1 Tax=Abeliophyllum distichum TaxID=126358 RepID=A0ABD1SZK8_9LAMI
MILSIVLWKRGSLSLKANETPRDRSNSTLLPPPYPSSLATSSTDRWFGTHAEASPCPKSVETISTQPPPSDSIHLEQPELEPDHRPSRSFVASDEEVGAFHSQTHLNAVLYIPSSKNKLVRWGPEE